MRRLAPVLLLTLPCLVADFSRPALAAETAVTAPTPHLREFTLQGARVTLDLDPQVLSVESPERPPGDPGIEATPGTPYDGQFVPAALLVQKAKQFDDGLYAAVELAAQHGAGDFGGKRALLDTLAAALADKPADDGASATVEAAVQLGGGTPALPPAMQRAAAKVTHEFESEPLRSKPIGFYTESPELGAIFRQDRMLQSALHGAGIGNVAAALRADANARRTYENYLALTGGLTNPPVAGKPDFRAALAALDGGAPIPAGPRYFFPPSRAQETDLLKRLFPGDAQIPDGFSLIDEMARQLRAGTLDLTPTAQSGWYDWSLWALEPLVAPERAAEAPKLALNAAYKKNLGDLFQGTLALTRETHIKQLDIPVAAGAAAPRPAPILHLTPQLRVEPLATYYLRRAQGYRFVAGVLQQTFGSAALNAMHRATPQGPTSASLAQELEQMQALFFGAYAAVCEDLGLTPDAAAATHTAAFDAWRAQLSKDADLKRDARMMVPLYFDAQRRRTKVLVFLGWTRRSVEIGFATPPRVAALAADPASLPPDTPPPTEVRFHQRYETLFYPLSAELLVPRLYDRDQFRALCDEKRSMTAILQALQH